MARAKDDDGEKEDELELMLLLGANERRLGRRSGPDNGWARDANRERRPRYPVNSSRNLSIIYLLTEPADIIYLLWWVAAVADKRGQENNSVRPFFLASNPTYGVTYVTIETDGQRAAAAGFTCLAVRTTLLSPPLTLSTIGSPSLKVCFIALPTQENL